MKKTTLMLSLILIITCTLCFVACNKWGSSLDCYYFKTGIHIETHDKSLSDKTVTELKNLFSNLENEFDNKKQGSLVYSFNNSIAGEKARLSNHGANVLSLSKRCVSFTDGLFDPSVYPLVKLWQFSPNYPVINFTPPTEEQILESLKFVGFDGLTFNADDNTLAKNKDGVMLDFGGIVKGYAADSAAEILKSAGHNSGYISIGGSSLRILSVESLGVIHPNKANLGQSILSINLKDKKDLSVSTSGD
ncbi:MAG: FAD:protein FMN transferase, partial [Clostridia bacterium]|nr:FAD:protein FMN transferase [Clostridia bacterium]